MGRLTMAARQLRVRHQLCDLIPTWHHHHHHHIRCPSSQEIAELQEKQDNKEVAIEFYQQAGDLFAGEESTADANKCRLKVAQFSAELGKYQEVCVWIFPCTQHVPHIQHRRWRYMRTLPGAV